MRDQELDRSFPQRMVSPGIVAGLGVEEALGEEEGEIEETGKERGREKRTQGGKIKKNSILSGGKKER